MISYINVIQLIWNRLGNQFPVLYVLLLAVLVLAFMRCPYDATSLTWLIRFTCRCSSFSGRLLLCKLDYLFDGSVVLLFGQDQDASLSKLLSYRRACG